MGNLPVSVFRYERGVRSVRGSTVLGLQGSPYLSRPRIHLVWELEPSRDGWEQQRIAPNEALWTGRPGIPGRSGIADLDAGTQYRSSLRIQTHMKGSMIAEGGYSREGTTESVAEKAPPNATPLPCCTPASRSGLVE